MSAAIDAGMAVGMGLVGRMGALPTGVNDEKIGEQVGKGMQAMRHQRL